MIDLIREYRPVRRRGLGEPLTATAVIAIGSAAVQGVKSLINLLRTTGKSGREDFFKARNQVTEVIARTYQSELGYSYDAMMHYWYGENQQRNIPQGPNGPNERLVIDRWFAELNKLNIGNDGSGDILKVQSISFKSFAPAFDRLQQAFDNYKSKYMSATSAPMETKTQAEQRAMQQQKAGGTSTPNTLMAKWDGLPSDRKTVIIGLVGFGTLALVMSALKATKTI